MSAGWNEYLHGCELNVKNKQHEWQNDGCYSWLVGFLGEGVCLHEVTTCWV